MILSSAFDPRGRYFSRRRDILMDKTERAYIEAVGHEPRNLPADHPDRWQWLYVGRSDEDKERLAELLGLPEEQPGQEESLF